MHRGRASARDRPSVPREDGGSARRQTVRTAPPPRSRRVSRGKSRAPDSRLAAAAGRGEPSAARERVDRRTRRAMILGWPSGISRRRRRTRSSPRSGRSPRRSSPTGARWRSLRPARPGSSSGSPATAAISTRRSRGRSRRSSRARVKRLRAASSSSSGSGSWSRTSTAGSSTFRPCAARTRSPTGTASTRASPAGNRSRSNNTALDMPWWHRVAVLGGVLLVTLVVARLTDRRLARRDLPAAAVTRYRVLRRSVITTIVFVGVLSALLVIPQVRAVATGILASSAVIGIVVGFAAQRTIGNFIAGLLIAFAQPVRLGDYVEIEGLTGVVEEIGLTYTFIRIEDNDRLVIPNERIASDTIRNSSIRGRRKLAQVTVQVPLDSDLDAVTGLLREAVDDERAEVSVAALEEKAQLMVSVWADDEPAAERLENELRLRAHKQLRDAGVFS